MIDRTFLCEIRGTQTGARMDSRIGLRFEVFLLPGLAEWVLNFVERGVFADPGEAVFVMLREQKDLDPYDDLRREILKRSFDAAINDPRPPIAHEELQQNIRKRLGEPRPEPALWPKNNYS